MGERAGGGLGWNYNNINPKLLRGLERDVRDTGMSMNQYNQPWRFSNLDVTCSELKSIPSLPLIVHCGSTGSHSPRLEDFLSRCRQSLIGPDQQGFHDPARGFSFISISRQDCQSRCSQSRAIFSYFGVYNA